MHAKGGTKFAPPPNLCTPKEVEVCSDHSLAEYVDVRVHKIMASLLPHLGEYHFYLSRSTTEKVSIESGKVESH